MNRTHKIVFIGEPGAGKTTCIAALSQIAPVSTDVACTDELANRKATTTVALDYGEIDLDVHGRLLLYGLPGQSRFRFMFDVVREGLLGAVVLVDASSPTALEGLAETLQTYAPELARLPCVLALNKDPRRGEELRLACGVLLRRHGLAVPAIVVDARRREDLVRIFDLLFMQLEYGADPDDSNEASTWA